MYRWEQNLANVPEVHYLHLATLDCSQIFDALYGTVYVQPPSLPPLHAGDQCCRS